MAPVTAAWGMWPGQGRCAAARGNGVRRGAAGRAGGGQVRMSMTQPIDVRDMAIVHRTFRKAYEESARLVRAEPAPTPGRVTFLADHIDFALAALHHHHEVEDELLYPKLIERAPDQALMTKQVEHEHEVIRTALESA